MSIQALEDQVIELQTRIAFQEDTVQKLNEVITEQDSHIRALQIQLQSLAKKVEDMSYAIEQRDIKPTDERPPHY